MDLKPRGPFHLHMFKCYKYKNRPENDGFPSGETAKCSQSALAELRSATGGLQAVLLSVLRVKTVDFTGFFRFSRLG